VSQPSVRRFVVHHADWAHDGAALRAVRTAVFVEEQGVPLELEVDEHDAGSLHVVARDEAGVPIGAGRLLADGHIGRMAVLRAWRGQGVGDAMLRALIEAARDRGVRDVVLNAQTHAVPFYARHGFVAEGDEFLDAGIPHQGMRLRLAPG
jgi:predicted GNAT family N-acyltransferase